MHDSSPKTVSPSLVIALISLPIFIGALDLTVVSAVLPHVVYDLQIPFQTGMSDAAWVVSGYLLAYTIAMTFMGRLSDIWGRRRVYLLALAIFALGSFLVAVADGFPTQLALRIYYLFFEGRPDVSYVSLVMLIAARMIQAFGGGAMVPVGMALASDLYPIGQRAKVLGVVAAVDTSGWVVGHLYGGIVARFFNWRMIFWLNLPVCLLAFILIALYLRGIPRASSAGRMDWLGALLIAASLTMLNIGLGSKESSTGTTFTSLESGLPTYLPQIIVIALVLMGLFIWHQAKAKSPLVPLRLFLSRNFTGAILANFFVGVCLFIAIADVPLFINAVVAKTLEQGTWDSGWMLCALTVPMALVSLLGGWLTARLGYRFPAILGIIIGVGGFILMSRWDANTSYWVMAPELAVAGIGLGLTMAPVAAAVIDASPEADRGISSSMVIIFRLIGMTIGVSALTTYGLRREHALTIQMLSPSADLAETARVGIAVAVRVINETFIITAIICLLALLPTLFIRNIKNRDV